MKDFAKLSAARRSHQAPMPCAMPRRTPAANPMATRKIGNSPLCGPTRSDPQSGVGMRRKLENRDLVDQLDGTDGGREGDEDRLPCARTTEARPSPGALGAAPKPWTLRAPNTSLLTRLKAIPIVAARVPTNALVLKPGVPSCGSPRSSL
jgi:hypothetical protein